MAKKEQTKHFKKKFCTEISSQKLQNASKIHKYLTLSKIQGIKENLDNKNLRS